MARLQTQEASGSTNLDDDVDSLLDARSKGELRDSMDSNHGAPRVAGIALRSQLADIKVGSDFERGKNIFCGGDGHVIFVVIVVIGVDIAVVGVAIAVL